MKYKLIKTAFAILILALSSVINIASAALITFEGIAPPGGAPNYNGPFTLDGFTFTPSHGHIADSAAGYNDNGTDFYIHDSGSLMNIIKVGNGLFSFDSVDLAHWFVGSTFTYVVNVEGWNNGIMVATQAINFNNVWQTASMSAAFGRVDHITLHNANGRAGYDNFVFDTAAQDVPEPSTLAIFALGLIGLSSRRFKKKS
jgi:hypothetical protein